MAGSWKGVISISLDLDALFKITYGLFVAGVESGGKRNGCIINTASQVTAEPPRLIVTMQKSNYTAELIRQKGSISLSVLSRDCPMDIVRLFGYQSGRVADKFSGAAFQTDRLGNPYLTEHVCAVVALDIAQTVDVDTHWLFICPVEDSRITSDQPGLTYEDYRVIKSGGSLPDAGQKSPEKAYTCTVCHYVYDGEIPFEDLPEDYTCPICGVPKSKFVLA